MMIKWGISILLSLFIFTGVSASETKVTLLVSHTPEFQHNDKSGGKGIDPIILTAPKTAANTCAVFKQANIQYLKRRYGVAKITTSPNVLCNPAKEVCKFGVSWQHSPAGGLDYKIQVTWSLVDC